ncbi:MAG: hypothetical protein ABW007_19205 [Chitinophagaceae bacterium]
MKERKKKISIVGIEMLASRIARKLFSIQIRHFKLSENKSGLAFNELMVAYQCEEVIEMAPEDWKECRMELHIYTALVELYTDAWNRYVILPMWDKGKLPIWRAAMVTFMMAEVTVSAALSEQLSTGALTVEDFLKRVKRVVGSATEQIHNHWFRSNETLKLSLTEL